MIKQNDDNIVHELLTYILYENMYMYACMYVCACVYACMYVNTFMLQI